jgi:rod shape determining protein RodA
VAQIFSIWKKVDWIIILIYIFMVLAGWINIYSAVYSDEHRSIFDMEQRYGKQMIWIVFAFVLAVLIMVTDSKFFVAFAFLIYGLFIFLLIVVLFFGKEVNGAKAWLMIGNFALQPSEFAKFGASLALAKVISSYDFNFKEINSKLLLAFLLILPILLIIFQNDTGSALVYVVFLIPLFREGMSGLILFFGFLFVILFVFALVLSPLLLLLVLIIMAFAALAIIRKRKNEIISALVVLAISTALMVIFFLIFKDGPFDFYYILLRSSIISSIILLAFSLYKRIPQAPLIASLFLITILFSFTVDFAFDNFLESHQKDRFNDLLGIESDPLGAGYNVNQSKIAIGSGGFFGKGFLKGTQTKYDFVPEQSTDFIFCTVGEEWGFVGTTISIAAFIYLLIRIVKLAERQRSIFSRVYGYCTASILFFHFTINIGMTIGLAPVIGIPLPFYSYGGSSLWFFTILLFVFLRLDASRFEQLH